MRYHHEYPPPPRQKNAIRELTRAPHAPDAPQLLHHLLDLEILFGPCLEGKVFAVFGSPNLLLARASLAPLFASRLLQLLLQEYKKKKKS